MSPRAREDLDAWLRAGHEALVGEQAHPSVPFATPFATDGKVLYELVPCAGSDEAYLNRYASQVGGDPLQVLVTLVRAGEGTAIWEKWTTAGARPPGGPAPPLPEMTASEHTPVGG